MGAIIYAGQLKRWNRTPQADWPSVAAHVLDTRVVVVGTMEHANAPGEIDYRAEILASYDLNGEHHQEWLAASDEYSERWRASFRAWRKKGSICIVRWNPRNPQDRIAVLS